MICYAFHQDQAQGVAYLIPDELCLSQDGAALSPARQYGCDMLFEQHLKMYK
jgi:hypothetical protein